jgi:hypothetical protein
VERVPGGAGDRQVGVVNGVEGAAKESCCQTVMLPYAARRPVRTQEIVRFC